MNRERELLELVVKGLDRDPLYRRWLKEKILAYLASEEPEKREPISEGEIYREMPLNCSGQYYDAFCDGVRWAEKMHGIGVVADSASPEYPGPFEDPYPHDDKIFD